MRLKYVVLTLLFSAISINAQDWVRFDSLLVKGIDQIYGIKFQEAEKTFKIVEKEYPRHPAGKFFGAMITWWKIATDIDNTQYDDEFYDQVEEAIDLCDDILDDNDKNVDGLFFKGGSLGFRGRLHAIRESWFDAALDGKEALPLIFKAYENDPTRIDVQMGFGIYNYYAAVIPTRYPVVKPFMVFFPKGDKDKGLKQLEHVAFNGRYTKIESRYFLMTLYFQFENNWEEAMKYAKLLIKDYPDNPVFQKYYGTIFVRKNDYESAQKVFRNVLDKVKKGYPAYNDRFEREAEYYIGMHHREKGNIDSTVYYLSKSVAISKVIEKDEPKGFLIMGSLYLAMAYDKIGRRQDAIKLYKEVLEYKDRSSSHKLAEQYLKTPYRD
jgi:tetratricopeptide (TPR) repeat protein